MRATRKGQRHRPQPVAAPTLGDTRERYPALLKSTIHREAPASRYLASEVDAEYPRWCVCAEIPPAEQQHIEKDDDRSDRRNRITLAFPV